MSEVRDHLTTGEKLITLGLILGIIIIVVLVFTGCHDVDEAMPHYLIK